MHSGQLVFAQLMSNLPLVAFSRFVVARRAQHKVKDFSCLDQFLVLSFAQLTGRESLRDIEANLRIHRHRWFHMGLRCQGVARNTLANANSTRPWEVFADLAHHLIATARTLYAHDPLDTELSATLNATVYALDSTTIDLCLSLFTWAPFRSSKAAVKLHTMLDLRGAIPSFIHISDGKMHDVRVLDILCEQKRVEPGAFYVMDKAYVDFARLFTLDQLKAYFVTRAKTNLNAQVVARFAVERSCGLIADEHIVLPGVLTATKYPNILRRVAYTDPKSAKKLIFLTNNLALPALSIAALYKQRWQVELFFKWIKQHLRIKAFLGTNENAVKTQIWCAIATYVLIAIAKKRLHLSYSFYEILRVLDLNLFETTPISALLEKPLANQTAIDAVQQATLF
jgi:Transposase DDE domain/Domain of unknown function (DUF4372)